MFQTRFWATTAALMTTIGWPGVSPAATLHVPQNYATIQACIDAAVSGVDECVVAPGTYHETINFLGKAITLRSSGGADVTTITATGIGGSVVRCISGEGPDTVLDGFTITGGTGWGCYDMSCGGGMYNLDSNPTVTSCTFIANTANTGGGMLNFASSPTVNDCNFTGNTVTRSLFGGIGAGGGMSNFDKGAPTVSNCTFQGNTAEGRGGGIYNSGYSNLTVKNSSFTGNTAASGGGISNSFIGSRTVANCILWGDNPDEIDDDGFSNPIIRFSNVQGGLPVGAIDGGGNIDLDPIFLRPPDPGLDGTWDGVDDDYGDQRLQAGSPCINAGDPGFTAQPGETDLEGHARVLCGRVDMGAYEFGIGDFDCDQTVDLTDFAHWSACATGPQATALAGEPPVAPSCETFDFDGDGDVDLLDFAAFQNAFRDSSP